MGLYDRFKRWKRRRGFGVHSPEAYRLVKSVIRPGKDIKFYGEEALELSDSSRRLVREAKLLLRFVAYENPAFVWTSPGIPEIFTEAIRHAGEVIRIFDGAAYPGDAPKADMTVIYKTRIDAKTVEKVMADCHPLIAIEVSEAFRQLLKRKISRGIILEWNTGLIAIPRDDMEKYVYLV